MLFRGLAAFGLTVVSIVVGGFLVVPALFLGANLATFALIVVLAELGFAVTAAVFVAAGETGMSYVKPGLPEDRNRTALIVAGSGVGLAVFAFTVIAAVNLIGISTQPSFSVDLPIHIPSLFLLMIPLSIFVIAPAEEFFFRGVLQTYLKGATTPLNAVLAAGILFALVHIPNYLQLPSVTAMLVMTAIIYVVGVGFGYIYERTESLPVAVGVHAVYNSLLMLGWYYLVTQGIVSF